MRIIKKIERNLHPKSVALVLASGGARGVAHIGVIQELECRGYHIHSVSGSSIGAVVGGLYAAGKLDEYADWLKDLSKIDVYRLLDFTLNLGFVKADKVFREIKKFSGSWNIEDLQKDLTIIAVDIITREEVVFNTGDLYTAIRSSIAYPSVITPNKVGKKLMVDGGVINPIPINRVKRKKGDILIAVDLSADIPYPKEKHNKKVFQSSHLMAYSKVKDIISRWKNDKKHGEEIRKNWSYFRLSEESLLTMHRQLSKLTLELYPPDVLIPISNECADLFDFYRSEELIEYGRIQASIALDKWEEKN